MTVTARDARGVSTTQDFPLKVTEPVPESRGRMYWTDPGTDMIQRASLDGSRIENLVTTGLEYPSGLALDVAGGKMYWVDAGTDRIQRANLDGSQFEDVIVSGLGYPTIGLALDPAGGKIYWTDWGTKEIRRSNLDGTRVENLVTGLSEPVGLALEIVVPNAPDLAAEVPSVNPPDPSPGQFFTLSAAIHNRGVSPAPATTLRCYRSTDSTITGDDTEVATRPLRALSAPGTSFKLIRLRAPTTRGTYYYGACVEPVDGEVETGNNCSPAAELVVR